MHWLAYYYKRQRFGHLPRWMLVGSIIAVAIIIIFWATSYRAYMHGSIDIHWMSKRFEWEQSNGEVYFAWMGIQWTQRGRRAGWETALGVELDSLCFGFGFYAAHGPTGTAGEIAVPHWALLVASLLPMTPLIYFHRKKPNRKI
jgi:hypothetical protein